MNANKLFSEFSLKKIWDKLLQHDKAMSSTLLILSSGNWTEQEDGTFKNTVSYSTFKDTDKLTVDLYDDGTDNSACGFSGRLITWVINILRWIKYILPVFVIILGILDFIKAIGSDKDDVMKQSQKKFIKRLVAAALVFLIPLIIEFILTKMGFDYNDCGLFK